VKKRALPDLGPFSIAQPRRMGFEGIYTGAELATRSSRPGAYDAMAIPSLFNGKSRPPAVAPVPASALAAPAPCSVRPYVVPNDAPPLPSLPADPTPEPEPDTAEAAAELETRKATLELWQSYVDALRARMAFDALAQRMRPFIPPHNMPAL